MNHSTNSIFICGLLYLFTGRCGHGSPCDQLCYELHDGMYECDCTEGYELNKNGYSCQGKESTTIIFVVVILHGFSCLKFDAVEINAYC